MTTADFPRCPACPTHDACGMVGRCLDRQAAPVAARPVAPAPAVESDIGNPISPRAAVLREAEALVCGDRQRDYGPPAESFARAAAMASLDTGHRLTPRDVVRVLRAVKRARRRHQPDHHDSLVDDLGYGGLEAEVPDDFAATVAALTDAPPRDSGFPALGGTPQAQVAPPRPDATCPSAARSAPLRPICLPGNNDA